VTVRDSGAGVAPALRSRLFEPFVSGNTDGLGLGLRISQRIALAHHGRIDVGDGEAGSRYSGAVFTLVLPNPARRTNDG